MKLALVYDRVNKIGGAERILVALHELWPEAPLYTAVYNPETAPWARDFKVIPSFLQKFPLARTNHELYPWLTPLAFESFNFDEYDVVISVTTAEAKGIITKPKTLHICYCLTPTRYLWSHYDLYFRGEFFRWLTKPAVAYLLHWDKIAAQRPDYFFALSENVKKRIKKYYGRDSEVVYPPVDVEKFKVRAAGSIREPASDFFGSRFSRDDAISQNQSLSRSQGKRSKIGRTPHKENSTLYTIHPTPYSRAQAREEGSDERSETGSYFLIVSRLVPYKRIELAIEAFDQLGLPLKIVGRGSEEGKLKGMAKKNIEFLSELTEEALLRYYQGCQALIFPPEEDLGLTPIEAQACGRPVIAFGGGGALETIIPGKTGEFFYPQTTEALGKVVSQFKSVKYQPDKCRRNAERFDKEIFKKKFKTKVEELWHKHLKTVM